MNQNDEQSAAPAVSTPRCPRCGQEVYIFNIGFDGIYVTCQGGNSDDDFHTPVHFQIKSLNDFAQFFQPSTGDK